MASTRSRRLARIAALPMTLSLVMALAGSALAAVRVVVVSQDPYTSTSSFHKTEVEPDTYSFGSTIVSTFQVGRFSNGGSNNLGWATSTDNGTTWSQGFLPSTTVFSDPPGPWARISDPSVAYDPQDDTWMILGLAIDNTVTGKATIVSRSTDGGLTWTAPVTVSQGGGGSFYDKSWIGCDTSPTSAFYGNCYVEWDDAGFGQTFKMSRSTDGGATWSASTVPNASVIGGQPLVQPNGTVVVPITGSVLESFTSTNGGQSYSGPFTISSIQTHFVNGSLRDGGGLASAEVDAAGKVYVAWHDCRFRSGCSANDIVMSTSTDGHSWTSVVRIPIDPTTSTADHFIPGMGVDHSTSGATAHLGITFYFYSASSCTVDTCKLAAGYVQSMDGGATWTAPVRIVGPIGLRTLPLTTLGYMVGDYISTSFSSTGRAFPVIAATHGTQNCTLGQITSCNEPMVTPRGGLAPHAGTIPVGRERPVAGAAEAGHFAKPKSAY